MIITTARSHRVHASADEAVRSPRCCPARPRRHPARIYTVTQRGLRPAHLHAYVQPFPRTAGTMLAALQPAVPLRQACGAPNVLLPLAAVDRRVLPLTLLARCAAVSLRNNTFSRCWPARSTADGSSPADRSPSALSSAARQWQLTRASTAQVRPRQRRAVPQAAPSRRQQPALQQGGRVRDPQD